ncbi:uncharacterized protein LOC125871138 [Solanum stenotomum]|uniref:uncharacterized protein LOC125871138 n=1 Tax=Solanum stenotomum TaxID=172797 RepID=UPI0020D00403|nr:uncharacterized protein LOC125871138 [Solanum stenotomum]
MRNIASCYNEHAIKVTNSYCSNPSNQVVYNIPSLQNVVTCIYKVKISSIEKQFLIKITWCCLLQHVFSISISEKYTKNFKKVVTILDKSKGSQTIELYSSRFDIYWDLSNAKYEGGPEPINGFFVKILVNCEVGLILGDMGHEFELKKLNLDDKFSRFGLVSRNEHFSSSSVLVTKGKFSENGKCHDILIKNSSSMLFVSIDKKSVIQVKRLQWNFRGNQTIFLDGLVVDFMWDVHDWLCNPKSGCAMFMFRTRSGLDSRLWFDQEKNLEQNEEEEEEKDGFSLMICATKSPD